MKLIIYADDDKLNLAIRAAKALDQDRKDGIFMFEGGAIFYVSRNKGNAKYVVSLTVKQVYEECSGVQMNTSTEHQMHETTPNAQRNVLPFAKSP